MQAWQQFSLSFWVEDLIIWSPFKVWTSNIVVRRLVIEYDHSHIKCLRGGAMYSYVACETDMGVETPPPGPLPQAGHQWEGRMLADWSVRALRVRRLSLAAFVERLFSDWMTPLWIGFLQAGLSDAAVAHVATSILKSFRLALRESFQHLRWPPTFLLPRLSSPYSNCLCLGIIESDIRLTYPVHILWALRMMVMMLERSALQNLDVGDLVLPADVENVAEAPKIELLEKFLMSFVDGPKFHWRREVLLRRLLCTPWYWCTVIFLFVSRLTYVVADFCIDVGRVREREYCRYRWSSPRLGVALPSLWHLVPGMAFLGRADTSLLGADGEAEVVPGRRECVHLPCVYCLLIAVRAPSSAKSRSRIMASLTFVTVCRRRRLKSFPLHLYLMGTLRGLSLTPSLQGHNLVSLYWTSEMHQRHFHRQENGPSSHRETVWRSSRTCPGSQTSTWSSTVPLCSRSRRLLLDLRRWYRDLDFVPHSSPGSDGQQRSYQ